MTVNLLNSDQERDLRSTFQKFDKNGDGKLSLEELELGMKKHSNITSEEVQEIMEKADTDKSGAIDYSEFLAVAMDKRKVFTKENLDAAFNAFDTDGSGSISADEVRAVFGRLD
jgi:calcium-dependent protein kinase